MSEKPYFINPDVFPGTGRRESDDRNSLVCKHPVRLEKIPGRSMGDFLEGGIKCRLGIEPNLIGQCKKRETLAGILSGELNEFLNSIFVHKVAEILPVTFID